MNDIALQLALLASGSVEAGGPVIFDTTLFSAGDISYNHTTGVVTLNEAGRYAFDWWVATQSSASAKGAAFAVSVSGGGTILGCSPLKTGQVGGFAVVYVSAPPVAVSLTNESAAAFFYAGAVPVKASLFVRDGLENLVDGNAQGALRGIAALSNYAMGLYAVALGFETKASGNYSNAEGFLTVAAGSASHAEGINTTASGDHSHAEGNNTTASGLFAHAEGGDTTALGNFSHAEGLSTTASGSASHAEGLSADTNGHAGAHIMGRFGEADTDYSWFLANGTDSQNLGLAAKILSNGEGHASAWMTGGADYAELFETWDGNPVEPGYFITFGSGKKIRKATGADAYILGVSAAASGYVGDAGELRWKDKYLADEWGRIRYHEVEVPELRREDGMLLMPARVETQPMLNPAWDPERKYVPRAQRPEWVCVGLLGKLLMRDDGTCVPDGCCAPNAQGVATAAATGYRVLERTGENQVRIMVK